MSNSTGTKHRELLNTQLNAEETHNKNSSELIFREAIEHTPFYLVGTEENGYFITMGRFKLTENQPTKEKAINQLTIEQWNIVMRMSAIIHESIANEAIQQIDTIKK